MNETRVIKAVFADNREADCNLEITQDEPYRLVLDIPGIGLREAEGNVAHDALLRLREVLQKEESRSLSTGPG